MRKLIGILASLFMVGSSFAFTTNDISVGTQFSTMEMNMVAVRTVTVDCSADNAAAGDIFYIMNIPSNCYVSQVFLDVDTASVTTNLITIGDTSSLSRFIGSTSITNLGVTASAITTASTGSDTNLVYASTVGAMTAQRGTFVYTDGSSAIVTNSWITNVTYTASTILTNSVKTGAITSTVTDKGYLYATGGKLAVKFTTAEATAKFDVTAVIVKIDHEME